MSDEQVQEVVRMRKNGYSLSAIGRFFGKDHTTILYHCKKYGIIDVACIRDIEPIGHFMKTRHKESFIIDGEKINEGKNYSDYLRDEKKRDWSKRKDIAQRSDLNSNKLSTI